MRILSTLDRELLKPSSSVALHRHSNALVDILPPEADSSIAMLGADERPDVKYSDVGGLDQQKQEIREAVELPLVQVCTMSITAAEMRGSRKLTVLDGPVQEDRYRPPSRCAALRTSRYVMLSLSSHLKLTIRYWKDHACQGCCQRHHRVVHPRRRIRVRAEVSWRGRCHRA